MLQVCYIFSLLLLHFSSLWLQPLLYTTEHGQHAIDLQIISRSNSLDSELDREVFYDWCWKNKREES